MVFAGVAGIVSRYDVLSALFLVGLVALGSMYFMAK